MSTWQPATRQEWYRLGAVAVALAVIGAGALAVAASEADADADVRVGNFSVADATTTADGNVTDVTVAADVTFAHEVPDAERRIIKLKVGPSRDDLTTVAFVNDRAVPGDDSGTVTLSGSVLDHPAFDASTINPAVADETTTEFVVAVSVEVHRSNGEMVRRTATDTATLTVTDAGELTVRVGGTGEITVKTDA